MSISAIKLLVNGLVQGVGFRPAVYKIAVSMNLDGWVKNTSNGVEIVLQVDRAEHFIHRLEDSLPSLASLDSINQQQIQLEHPVIGFRIVESDADEFNDTIMPPDSYVCQDCLHEIFDPNSRYFLYPFTNCTNCGPRYTVIKDLPYDRSETSLSNFQLCTDCNSAYQNPDDRRYHAQATACKKCGPKLDYSLSDTAKMIADGKIIALKSVGGYVLVVDAKNSNAVSELRKRKHRKSKPFAVMALNTASIRRYYAHVSEHEAGLLESTAAPIVILRKRSKSLVAAEVAPRLSSLGVMLPNSPIHYLLFYYLLGSPSGSEWLKEPNDLLLVFTSANLSGGAIISDDAEADRELAYIADHIVHYNRDIVMKNDDSVILALGKHDILLRRARGYAPKPYYFDYKMPQVLGLGAELKNTITYTRDNKAYVSQYMGDMSSLSTIDYFKRVSSHYQNIFNFKPELVVSDLHPDFYTTQYAESLGIKHIKLQHHFAHFASALANAESYGYTLDDNILGCILDGYGYGLSGESWGGELIKFNNQNFEFIPVSQLLPLMMPGGDKAEQEPWRIAAAMCIEHDLPLPEHLANQPQIELLTEMVKRKQFGYSTAFGRRFSIVAALLNIVTHAEYEAHAAMTLESLVTEPEIDHDFVRMTSDGKPDINIMFKHLYQIGIVEKNVQRAINVYYGSYLALIEKWIIFHCSMNNIKQVAVSGGCWQNRYLLPNLGEKFKKLGIELLVPYQMPVNDESISFGQAWYGAQLIMRGKI